MRVVFALCEDAHMKTCRLKSASPPDIIHDGGAVSLPPESEDCMLYLHKARRRTNIRRSTGEAVFDFVIYLMMTLALLVVAYPLYFVVIASFSDPDMVNRGKVILWVKDFNVRGYARILQDGELWTAYLNTIIYTVCGTLLSVTATMALGYPLSREHFSGRRVIMVLVLITMYFSGGMIPTYLLIKGMNLRNTRTIMVILGMVSAYNVIISRTFLQSNISEDLEAAASIDGCGQVRFFFQMVLPLSKAVISVLTLYYGIAKWNDYMNPLLYIDDPGKRPLALALRDILIVANGGISFDTMDPMEAEERLKVSESVKYGVMIVSTVPVLCLYPFLQKYFAKGAMIGSVKG